ncbi:MAG: putative porin, partial [Verrucomicrobiota bacterium]
MKLNKQTVTAVISAALLTGSAAFGQSGDAILDLLTKKGVISQKEANAAREQLDAQNAQTFDAYNKIKVSSWVNNLTFFGDGRLRYEYRSGSGNLAGVGPNDTANFDRFRYRFRVGVTGEFQDNFSYGLRLETGSGGNSANVTMGGQGFSKSPWAKGGNEAIQLGQFWGQYKVADWLTIKGGRFDSPYLNYGMGWKDDINPEGFAEKFSLKTEKVDYFLTFGEFVYNNTVKQNAFGAGVVANSVDTWWLGVQGGGKVKFTKDISLTLAPTFYTYTNPDQTTAGIFAPTLAGGNITGVNKLNVFSLPGEVAFPIPGINLPGKVFGEFAINTTGNARSTIAGLSRYGDQDIAYQVGASIGSNKKKH